MSVFSHAHLRSCSRRPLRRRVKALLAGTAMSATALTAMAVAPSAHAVGSGTWDRLATCESGGKWSINTGNGFSGGLQFTHSTWQAFGGAAHAPSAHQATKAQQIAVAERVLDAQGWGAWPGCSKSLGLR